jgi:4-hydroxybenzoate polyprenyltransferase
MASEPHNWPEAAEPTGRTESFAEGALTRAKRTWRILEYSSLYLAVVASVKVLIVTWVLSLPLTLAPLVGALVTFAVYANDRITYVEADTPTDPAQAAFVRRHEDRLYTLAAIAYGLAIALSVIGGPLALAITILPGVFWVVYALEWIPDVGVEISRLKELLIVNSTVVALAWALSLTFLPLAYADVEVTPTAAVVFAYFFLGTFVSTEIPNVPDVESDRAVGVRTMPLVFGVPRTRQALYAIDLVAIALVGYAAATGYLAAAPAAALVVGLVYSLGVVAFVGRSDAHRLLTIGVECQYLVVAVVLAVSAAGA